MRVRILCGAYDPATPFIEGGCSHDWIDVLEEPAYPLECPKCRQRVHAEVVECAMAMLASRSVFVFGCTHRAFTFSRRERSPYFSPEPAGGEV